MLDANQKNESGAQDVYRQHGTDNRLIQAGLTEQIGWGATDFPEQEGRGQGLVDQAADHQQRAAQAEPQRPRRDEDLDGDQHDPRGDGPPSEQDLRQVGYAFVDLMAEYLEE